MLICEPGYANPHLSSASEKKVTTLCKEQVWTCNNNAFWLLMLLSSEQTSFALIGCSQRAELNSAAISSEKYYSQM
jgi:hypothetical protein